MKNPFARNTYKPLNKKIKQEILKRDNYFCQECGSKDNLHIHHKTPYLAGGSESPDNLITLCSSCHGIADKDWKNKTREWHREEEKQPGYYDDLPDWLKPTDNQPDWDWWEKY